MARKGWAKRVSEWLHSAKTISFLTAAVVSALISLGVSIVAVHVWRLAAPTPPAQVATFTAPMPAVIHYHDVIAFTVRHLTSESRPWVVIRTADGGFYPQAAGIQAAPGSDSYTATGITVRSAHSLLFVVAVSGPVADLYDLSKGARLHPDVAQLTLASLISKPLPVAAPTG